MYKKIVLFSFLSLSPLTIAATTISCGSSDNNQEPGDNNQKPIVTNELQKLLEEDKIKISPNSLGIPKTYFKDCLNVLCLSVFLSCFSYYSYEVQMLNK